MRDNTERFMSTIKVGPKGQIVIPKEVRDMFGIQPGDGLIIMADAERGIGLLQQDFLAHIADTMFADAPPRFTENESSENMAHFAYAVKTTIQKGKTKE